ncbi:MAG: T9SS type A sorting domain-containing protein [Chitinophagales bacterium]
MKNIFALISFLSLSISSFAQWSTDSLQNTLVRYADSAAIYPLVATAPNGNTFVAWYEQTQNHYIEKMQLFDVTGHRLWDTAGLLISDHEQDSTIFDSYIACDHDGNVIFSFQDRRSGPIYPVVYKLDESGNFLWGADGIQLHDTSSDFQGNPQICIFDNNDMLITWVSGNSHSHVAYEKINADGTLPWASSKSVYDPIKHFTKGVSIPQSGGKFLMAYVDEVPAEPYSGIVYANRFDSNGDPVWAQPTKISGDSILVYVFPIPINDGKNGMFVSWLSLNEQDHSYLDSRMQHIDSTGVNLLGANGAQIADIPNMSDILQSIVYVPDSNQLVALLQVENVAETESGISIQKISADGAPLWGVTGKQLIEPTDLNFPDAASIVLANQSVLVFYTEQTSNIDILLLKLKGFNVDLNGNILWHESISAVDSHKGEITAGSFMNDQVIAFWKDERSGVFSIYAQNVSSEGNLGPAFVAPAENSFVNVYPSLTDAIIYVEENHSSGPSEFALIDLFGKRIITQKMKSGTNEIDLSSLPAGLYLYELQTTSGIVSGKIMKQ